MEPFKIIISYIWTYVQAYVGYDTEVWGLNFSVNYSI